MLQPLIFCVANMVAHPVAQATEKSPFGSLSPSEFYARHRVSHSSRRIPSSVDGNAKLFAQWWAPLPPTPTIGTVAVLHGFSASSSSLTLLTSVLLAKSGFATCALDYPGHGLSDGLPLHLPDISPVVRDCAAFFRSFRQSHAPKPLPSFLYGESLGGAIALLVALRSPSHEWDGLVLSGAMCGLASDVEPPWPLEKLLEVAAAVVPTWPVAFTGANLVKRSFKVGWKRRLAAAGAKIRLPFPRAATALELLRICREVKGRFADVDLPLLIVHGGDDAVCDPACLKELYRVAPSKDKTIRIYPGMWHQLIGEDDEGVDLVFGEVVEWLRDRAQRAAAAAATGDGGA